MGADSNHPSFVQNNNFIGIPDSTNALCHDHPGGILQLIGESPAELGIGAVVQSGKGIIKDQDLRLPGERAGNGEPLFLTTGDIGAALSDGGCQPAGEFAYKFCGLGQIQCRLDIRI